MCVHVCVHLAFPPVFFLIVQRELTLMYSAYMNEFKIAMQTLARYEQTSPTFLKLVKVGVRRSALPNHLHSVSLLLSTSHRNAVPRLSVTDSAWQPFC